MRDAFLNRERTIETKELPETAAQAAASQRLPIAADLSFSR